jgi:hypothetical protein
VEKKGGNTSDKQQKDAKITENKGDTDTRNNQDNQAR